MKLEIEIPDEVVKDLAKFMETGVGPRRPALDQVLQAHDAIIAELKSHVYQNRKPNHG
jgi:hypothetical protein